MKKDSSLIYEITTPEYILSFHDHEEARRIFLKGDDYKSLNTKKKGEEI